MKRFFKHVVVALLTWEARRMLAKHQPFVIAITGSVGKTTTKDAIFHVLDDGRSVRKSEKSFNSELGIPLTILGLPNAWYSFFGWMKNLAVGFFRATHSRDYPNTLVLEVGADHPGDIRRVTEWLHPDIAVVTRLPDTPVHVEFFASPEDVRKEKAELVRALWPGGLFVGNADDAHVRELKKVTSARMFMFGMSAHASVRTLDQRVRYGENGIPLGMEMRVETAGTETAVFLDGVLGAPPVLAALAAFAVGVAKGLLPEDIAKCLANFRAPPGRMRIISGKSGTIIIDDSYNSSAVAALEALKVLRGLKGKRKIAMLGDMLELGEFAEAEHKKVGNAASFVDLLLVVGKRARWIAEGATEAGLAKEKSKAFADSETAGKWMAEHLREGDVVLAKGSQGSGADMIRMERAVALLMAHPEDAGRLLVRQEKEWLEQYRPISVDK